MSEMADGFRRAYPEQSPGNTLASTVQNLSVLDQIEKVTTTLSNDNAVIQDSERIQKLDKRREQPVKV